MGKQYLNGVIYGTGEIIKFSPYIYSLEEREVGVWTDGKPLYEKTWILNYTAHTTAEHNTSIDIHDLNVEVPIAISGFWRRWAGDGKKLYYHWGSGEPTYGQGWARVDSENGYTNGRLAISIKSDGTDYQQVTLQYTKTTDNPGTGKWAQDGIPAVHYDGNEKIIGTWFGQTLYQKTIWYQSPIDQHDSKTVIDATLKNGINCFIVDISGIQTFGYLNYNPPTTNIYSDAEPLDQRKLHLTYYEPSTLDDSGYINCSRDGICFTKNMRDARANAVILTVRYIKITT